MSKASYTETMKMQSLKRISVGLILALFLGGVFLFSVTNIFTFVDAQQPVNVQLEVGVSEEYVDGILEASEVDAEPVEACVKQTINVIVTVKDAEGKRLEGYKVIIYVSGIEDYNIDQEEYTDEEGVLRGDVRFYDTGTATISAGLGEEYGGLGPGKEPEELIFSDVEEIDVVSTSTPVLNEEPEFTKGLSNNVSWNDARCAYGFEAQVSETEEFGIGIMDIHSVEKNSYRFTDLEHGEKYYYRTRSQSGDSLSSDWSNVVFSTQDAEPPVTDVASGTYEDEEIALKIQTFDDVSGVDYVTIFGNKNGGDFIELGLAERNSKVFEIDDLAGHNPMNWDGEFCFYSEGVDNVGNQEEKDKSDLCLSVEKEAVGDFSTKDVVEGTALDLVNNVNQTIESNPELTTIAVAAPLVTSTISLAAFIGFDIFSLGEALSRTFISFIGVLGSGKGKKPWGVVYDSDTKEPISRAVVRLFSDGKLVDTSVTDILGTFYFAPKKGTYEIKVSKAHYKFPSERVKGKSDFPRKNIYVGGKYEVKKDREVINVNIPLDAVSERQGISIIRKVYTKFVSTLVILNPYLLVFGAALSYVEYLIFDQRRYFILFWIYIVMLGINLYTRFFTKARWGIVVDEDGEPLEGVEIGLYDRKYGKKIDRRFTDEKGQFKFVVPGREYYLKPVRQEYVIAEEEYRSKGYPVGQKTEGNIHISQRVKVRKT